METIGKGRTADSTAPLADADAVGNAGWGITMAVPMAAG